MRIFGYDVSVTRPSDRLASGPVQRSGGAVPVSDWLRGADYGGSTYSNPFTQVSFVYRAVTALAEQVANIPFRFAAIAEGKDRITTGRLHEFYSRPHPNLNGFQYWELRVMWLLLRGECFRVPVYEERNGKRHLDRVMMLDPSRFRHIVEDGELVGWRYSSQGTMDPGQTRVFLPDEVWHERLPNPFDPWRGLSPLSVAAAPAAGEYAATQWMRGLMENNGNAGLVVRTEEPLDHEQREQLKQALRERRRGVGVADAPLLLWGGAEIMQPKAAAADLQLLDHRKFSVAEICAAFGVPEEIVTSINAAKYDVMRGARLSFVENRVVPLCRRLEAEEQVCVRAIEPGAKGFFEVEEHPVLATARRDRLKTAQAGFAMGIPLNELNRALDLGFKPLPWGDAGYVAGNLVRADEKKPADAQKG
jgi:HK97 family phage portal protein